MIQIHLEEDEYRLLAEMLQSCLHDLSDEISHTDRFEYKEMLKKRRQILTKMLKKLEHTEEQTVQ